MTSAPAGVAPIQITCLKRKKTWDDHLAQETENHDFYDIYALHIIGI